MDRRSRRHAGRGHILSAWEPATFLSPIYLLTKGGPGTSTFNLAVYAFEQSIANLKLGVGAATGVIMMIMLSIGSVIYLRSAGFAREEAHG